MWARRQPRHVVCYRLCRAGADVVCGETAYRGHHWACCSIHSSKQFASINYCALKIHELKWISGVLGMKVVLTQVLVLVLVSTMSRMALGPTQPPIQWVPGVLSLGVKQLGCEADHSPPSSAKVRMCGAIPPLPQYAFVAWCSVKAQGLLYLYLYI
jgi:hypothetical protein